MDFAVIELLKGERFSLMNERISAMARQDRKRKIQELKAQGYKQKDVIKLLGLSERTVRADWK